MHPKNQEVPPVERIRHSLAHILAMAVLKKFPKAQLGIGPTIENGFYYDFKLPKPLTDADLPELEKTMREYISANLDFTGENITPAQAKKIFKGQPFKLDLVKDFVKEKKNLTVYATCPSGTGNWAENRFGFRRAKPGNSPRGRILKIGNCFIDLCKGGHVKNTREIPKDAFTLTHVAGAYWKGDEKNPMLTRIYGVAFETKKELDEHRTRLEEAKQRDHKRLGLELDLFTFSDLVGPGLPLWTPKGTVLRNILDDFVWDLRKARGYAQVDIPHITKKELYEESGHWEKFHEELFKIKTREGHLFAMKPMNCPHHTQIFARRLWSYRDMPQRYASTTKVYRDEQTGELSGLSRVRAITQDDAHVFCRKSQIEKEILAIWDIVHAFYGKAGFSLRVRLSLSDPKNQKAYLGSRELWQEAEETLRKILKEKNASVFEAIGEAAFYGPKIDFLAHDSLGREWQVATIQLDMNLPERFDLSCINEKGERERIVMIHAAIMGSIERYISILIEHFAGAFPFWMSPVQIGILTINDSVAEYARGVARALEEKKFRVFFDDRNETIGKKIREAELQKIPYIAIVGPKEKEAGTVAVRKRGKGDLGPMAIEQFLSNIAPEEQDK